MEKLISKKILYTLITLAGVSMIGTGFLQYDYGNLETNRIKATDGVATCSKRVQQSFTALMIREFTSPFLTADFQSNSDACFTEVKKILTGISASSGKMIDNLISDVHWFYKKSNKIIALNQESYIDISQSNVVSKFEEIEILVERFQESLNSDLAKFSTGKKLSLLAIGVGQVVILLSLAALFLLRRKEKEEQFTIEARAQKILSAKLGLTHEDAVTILSNTFKENAVTGKVLKNYINELYAKVLKYENTLLELNSESRKERIELDLSENSVSNDTIIKPAVEFNTSVNGVLEKLKARIFERGVVVDTNLSEDFSVYSQEEALDQLLYNAISFSLDKLKSTSGKITIRNKPLGGIAYCKIITSGIQFSTEEINYLNGHSSSKENINNNLKVVKECLEDTFANLAVRNLQKETEKVAEIEFIFERQKEALSKNTTSVKTTKSELREIIRGRQLNN